MRISRACFLYVVQQKKGINSDVYEAAYSAYVVKGVKGAYQT